MQHISPYWGAPGGTTAPGYTFLERSRRADAELINR